MKQEKGKEYTNIIYTLKLIGFISRNVMKFERNNNNKMKFIILDVTT